jgi:hypothetical protein
MTQIEPIVFPLGLGTANKLITRLMVNTPVPGAIISYTLMDGSTDLGKGIVSGNFQITEEDYVANGNDKEWITNYVVERLGITLLQNG